MMPATGRVVSLFLCLVIVSCGDVKTGDPDASDAPADVPEDTTVDTAPDATPDATPDGSPDADPDPDPDAEDAPEDLPSDTADEWPTENPTDWPHPTSGQCLGQGGFCSGGSELLCPWGYEPVGHRPHRGCASDGWCCIVAPYSECTDSGEANCFEGTTCTGVDGCLGDPTTAYTCETDRVCCVDVCG